MDTDIDHNKDLPLHKQILRTDYIQPKHWLRKPTYKLVLPIYFRDVKVPSGFITDMGSIPRFLWFLFDPINQYAHAVVIHDYALGIMSRPNADARFREALRAVGVDEWRVMSMYKSVLYYGYSAEYCKARYKWVCDCLNKKSPK